MYIQIYIYIYTHIKMSEKIEKYINIKKKKKY